MRADCRIQARNLGFRPLTVVNRAAAGPGGFPQASDRPNPDRNLAMGPLDAIWHLINLVLPALGVGLFAAGLAKLLWRRELKGVAWGRLALAGGLAAALCLMAGLLVLGRDGRMVTYAGVVFSTALALWWTGFGPGRR
jgi:hypothetical protein